MKYVKFLIVLLLLFTVIATVDGESSASVDDITLWFDCIGDSYINSNSPNKNYGSEKDLKCRYFYQFMVEPPIVEQTLLKFEVLELSGSDVKEIHIILDVISVPDYYSLDINIWSSDSFDETDVTWNNKPPLVILVNADSISDMGIHDITIGNYDIIEYTTYYFSVLTNMVNTRGTNFGSRESVMYNIPKLKIVMTNDINTSKDNSQSINGFELTVIIVSVGTIIILRKPRRWK